MTASEHTELLPALLAWLKKRGQPDSGITYSGPWNDEVLGRQEGQVRLFGTDAKFIADNFHGKGARDLAAALEAALAALPDGAEPVPVAWRPVADEPVAISVLARFFDNEMGEWVYTVFDPGPVKLAMAGPYSEWLPLDTFNRPIFVSPAGMGVTEEQVERAATELARHDLAHMFPDRDNLPMDQVLPLIAVLREPARLALEAAESRATAAEGRVALLEEALDLASNKFGFVAALTDPLNVRAFALGAKKFCDEAIARARLAKGGQ